MCRKPREDDFDIPIYYPTFFSNIKTWIKRTQEDDFIIKHDVLIALLLSGIVTGMMVILFSFS